MFPAVLLSSYLLCFGQVAWVNSYSDGLKQAAAAPNKYLVLDLSASWCGFCRRMEREVYTDKDFVEFSRSQVFLRLMADTSPEGEQLARRFRVVGFPTIVVLNAEGEEVGRLVGARGSAVLMRQLKEIFARTQAP
jgi:thiol:disulfide interchange protein